jgi:hypothetical protein
VRYTCWQNSFSRIVPFGRAKRADHEPKPLLTAYCQAHVLWAMLVLWALCLANGVSAAHDVPKLCATIVLLLSLRGEHTAQGCLASCRRLTVRTERRTRSARPPNDPVVKLHGQGPRAEAGAARRLPACEARDAGGVTPRKFALN